MGMHYIKQGMESGGSKSPGWAYLTHMLGQGSNLQKFTSLSDSDVAASVLPKPAVANTPVFYHNGKTDKPRTKAEIVAYADSEMQRKLTEFKVPLAIGGVTVASNTTATKDTQLTTGDNSMLKASFTQKPTIDSSNPEYKTSTLPANKTLATKPASGFGIFNKLSNEQVLAANQPIQKGTDPARDFKGLGETNEILSKQLNVLSDIKLLASQIVAGLGKKEETTPVENNAIPNKPNDVRSKNIPITTMTPPMVSRSRTTV